jgi:3',5'-cyclic AMP phosphodiesterase CpdA
MNPQPDFVLYGGDLAQLGQPAELELGAQILKEL